jgi:hypothetical protein
MLAFPIYSSPLWNLKPSIYLFNDKSDPPFWSRPSVHEKEIASVVVQSSTDPLFRLFKIHPFFSLIVHGVGFIQDIVPLHLFAHTHAATVVPAQVPGKKRSLFRWSLTAVVDQQQGCAKYAKQNAGSEYASTLMYQITAVASN